LHVFGLPLARLVCTLSLEGSSNCKEEAPS
jgi:hypothetical protein